MNAGLTENQERAARSPWAAAIGRGTPYESSQTGRHEQEKR